MEDCCKEKGEKRWNLVLSSPIRKEVQFMYPTRVPKLMIHNLEQKRIWNRDFSEFQVEGSV